MKEARHDFGAVCNKGEVYVFSGYDDYRKNRSVEKYLPETNTWKYLNNMIDYRGLYSACSFMDDVYIIGGLKSDWQNTATCFKFNTKSFNWKEISRMNMARRVSASSVFEERIFVSGGRNFNGEFNTVEAYDHVGDTWEKMPNMINESLVTNQLQ